MGGCKREAAVAIKGKQESPGGNLSCTLTVPLSISRLYYRFEEVNIGGSSLRITGSLL